MKRKVEINGKLNQWFWSNSVCVWEILVCSGESGGGNVRIE